MRGFRGRALAAISALALFSASAPGAAQQTRQSNCDRGGQRATSFAIAGFNLAGEQRRHLVGNAFIVFAQATEYCGRSNSRACELPSDVGRRRVWKTVVVTARHVIIDACANAGPEMRLTLLPDTPLEARPSVERRRGLHEIVIDEAWCRSFAEQAPDVASELPGPDIVAFEQDFAIPTRTVIRPFTIAFREGLTTDVTVLGFVPQNQFVTPPASQRRSGQPNPSTAEPSFRNIAGLYDGPEHASVGERHAVNYRELENTVFYYRELERGFFYHGMSGSPVVDTNQPNIVYGVLTNEGNAVSCSRALENEDEWTGGSTQISASEASDTPTAQPAASDEDEEEDPELVEWRTCQHTSAIGQANAEQYQTGYMISLLDYGYLYADLTALQAQRDARIEATLELFKEVRVNQLEGRTDEDSENIYQTFTDTLRDLTALEQIRFWGLAYEHLQELSPNSEITGVTGLPSMCVNNRSMRPTVQSEN